MREFASAADLTETSRSALRSLLVALADTKMLLGFHYGEWTFGTPALEASIAACSMSQDEFGHLRLLHGCLAAQFEQDTAGLIDKRPATQFSNAASLDQPLQSWADFVAANLLTDGAATVVLRALQRSTFTPIANFVDKMIEEEKHHVRNAQGWFSTLANNSEATKTALAHACRRVLPQTLEWLGPESHEAVIVLAKDRIINQSWGEVRQRLLEWVGELAEENRVDCGVNRQNGEWRAENASDLAGWNPLTRRCHPGQPAEQLLYHLRGNKNEVFKLA